MDIFAVVYGGYMYLIYMYGGPKSNNERDAFPKPHHFLSTTRKLYNGKKHFLVNKNKNAFYYA